MMDMNNIHEDAKAASGGANTGSEKVSNPPELPVLEQYMTYAEMLRMQSEFARLLHSMLDACIAFTTDSPVRNQN